MSDEHSEAMKVESAEIARTDGPAPDAEPNRLAEKEKRVATYLIPNVLLIAVLAALYFPVGFLFAPLSIVSMCFGTCVMIDNDEGNYKNAARNSLIARIFFG